MDGRLGRHRQDPFFASRWEGKAMKSARWLLLAGGIVLLGFWSVEPGAGQEKQTEKGKGTLVKLDGLESRTPPGWYEEKPNNRMRLYQFRLSPVGDDKDNAEVVIFYFGEGQGGSAEENIKRWKGLFTPPQGKRMADVAKVQKMNVGKIWMSRARIASLLSTRTPRPPSDLTTACWESSSRAKRVPTSSAWSAPRTRLLSIRRALMNG
jgi:hypothetical protein